MTITLRSANNDPQACTLAAVGECSFVIILLSLDMILSREGGDDDDDDEAIVLLVVAAAAAVVDVVRSRESINDALSSNSECSAREALMADSTIGFMSVVVVNAVASFVSPSTEKSSPTSGTLVFPPTSSSSSLLLLSSP